MRLGIAGLAAFVLLTGIAAAQPLNDCRERIRQAEFRLDRIVQQYGSNSRQAWDARQELLRIRDLCYRPPSNGRDHRP